jgi:hypothetical protein
MAKIVSRGNVTVEFTPEEFDFLSRLLGHHILGSGRFKDISDGIFKVFYSSELETSRLPTEDYDCISLREEE